MISGVNSSGLTQTQGVRGQHRHGGKGQRPELPDSFKSVIDSAVQANKQAGGSPEDLQKAVAAKYEAYKKTDDYKALSADQKTQLDALVKNGPRGGHRPEGPPPDQAATTATTDPSAADATDPSTVAKQLMDVLSQRGDQTRSRLGLDFGSDANSLATSIEE